jgi:hypothetical protein
VLEQGTKKQVFHFCFFSPSKHSFRWNAKKNSNSGSIKQKRLDNERDYLTSDKMEQLMSACCSGEFSSFSAPALITKYQVSSMQGYRMSSSDTLVKTVLILAANPKGTSRLRLDEEVREIDAGLQRSGRRDQFNLVQRWAVRPRDVYRAMLDFKPQIVHFCGHGAVNGGLALEAEAGEVQLVDAEALAGLFELFSVQLECVLLNACYSEVQANAISQRVDYVIGMNQAIGDRAAINFAVGFYDALGAGESFDFAYKIGCKAIHLYDNGIPEHLTPVIKKKR